MVRIYIFFVTIVCQFSVFGAGFKPVLNVLAPQGVLLPKIISQFENEFNCNVRIEFVGSRFEYESRLRAGLRNYDAVFADERILQRLYLARQLRSLNDDVVFSTNYVSKFPLQARSRLNLDGRSYVTLMVDPMGIVYNKKNFTLKQTTPTWDWLISPQDIPYWRQRVFVSNFAKQQLLIALLATGKEITATSWFIPEPTVKWLQSLKLQSATIDYPLELAFLGNKIEAAVVFRSEYIKLRKVVPELNFIVPNKVTYYDRIGVAIVSDTVQEALAQNFIKFLTSRKENIIANNNYINYNVINYEGSATKNWIAYDDELPMPKRIENILNELFKK